MTNRSEITKFPGSARMITLLLVTLAMAACQSMPKSDAPMKDQPAVTETGKAQAPTQSEAGASITTAVAAAGTEPAMAEPTPPSIVESCKDEPYAGYEKHARESIAKGLAATEAGTYGVGFRDRDEHKKWTATHNQLFERVNNSCQALSDCAKQNPKDKEAKCAEQAKSFAAWQALAAQFAEKAKLAETTQPPFICSFTPNLNDAVHCFHDLATNVDKACEKAECKELSACWNSVGYLDTAITQAERACGFVHEPLDKCRGYVETKERRGKKFEQCKTLQGRLAISVIPVL